MSLCIANCRIDHFSLSGFSSCTPSLQTPSHLPLPHQMRRSLYTMTGQQKGFSPACWAAAQWRFREMEEGWRCWRGGGAGAALLLPRQHSGILCLCSLSCPVPAWRGTLTAFATSEILPPPSSCHCQRRTPSSHIHLSASL